MGLAGFVNSVQGVSIEREVVCVTVNTNGGAMCLHIPLFEFRVGLAMANRTVTDHDDGGGGGSVLPFPKH